MKARLVIEARESEISNLKSQTLNPCLRFSELNLCHSRGRPAGQSKTDDRATDGARLPGLSRKTVFRERSAALERVAGSPDAGACSHKKLPPKSREFARPDSLPDASHGVKEEREVVVRQQHRREHLARHEQVAQVRARMPPADGAGARLVERAGVRGPARVLDVQFAARGERLAVAPVARRHHAVEHVN